MLVGFLFATYHRRNHEPNPHFAQHQIRRPTLNNAKEARKLLNCANVRIALETMPLHDLLAGQSRVWQAIAFGSPEKERVED
jgi:hypothetical protein